ncbi:MAG: class I SAM-dependent RNA methyltransferase [Alphaproteobacteria bacterium]|nr:class I SAM-dependent RNA methyltransferase [Alphaproteobacteria bacterium]
MDPLEIFLVSAPGLEPLLAEEAQARGFVSAHAVPGGVTLSGGWAEAQRACLVLRGASRVLVRIAHFPAAHLAQLDKRARKINWADLLRPEVPVKVEASCKGSRIYHAGAAAERISNAIRDGVGPALSDDAPVRILVRIQKNVCTISVDMAGEPLHRRGFKEAVAKAPMRETLAALFLRACGYDGAEPVLDPMCGSGTFVIEAAEIAAGLAPGRGRSFAFEQLAGFDPDAWAAMQAGLAPAAATTPDACFHGSDRDPGAIRMAGENASRAGVAALCRFEAVAVKELQRPDGPPGLIIVNPPYGERVSNRGALVGVHRRLGQVLRERFTGWRVGLVTSDASLAKVTGLPFGAPGPFVDHGGLKIRLHQTGPLT